MHDIKYNEEKQTIAFRTGRLGVHGLAAFKFINIPFQSWELKPEMGRNARGGVALSVSAAIVQAEFIVRVSGSSDSLLFVFRLADRSINEINVREKCRYNKMLIRSY